MRGWLYIVACFIVPQVWAVVVARVFTYRERRRNRGGPPGGAPPDDYTV